MGFYLNIYSRAGIIKIRSAFPKFFLNQIFTFKFQILINESKSLNPENPQAGYNFLQNPYCNLIYLRKL
jgi:hypothetical protein